MSSNPVGAAPATESDAMVRIPGGEFVMGSAEFYPEECPPHPRTVATFALDRQPVTNLEFAHFVAATGHRTTAELVLDPEHYGWLSAEDRQPGSTVFVPSRGPVNLRDWRQWWTFAYGADWQHPFGPTSSLEDRADHPVVHISYTDAVAYAEWCGKRLPTEAEFEYAARGGQPPSTYAWGNERDPDGTVMANTWRGRFPYLNTGAAGWVGTSPVGTFAANGYGLYDTIGNVWEWTSSYYTASHAALADPNLQIEGGTCCGPADHHDRLASAEPGSSVPRRVLKGGSHLCAPEYCLRYRPSARSAQAEDSPTSHIGFRCARSVPEN